MQRRGLLKVNQEGKLEFCTNMNRDYKIPWIRVFLEEQVGSQLLKKYPALVERENSLSCSHDPTTGSYLDPEFDVITQHQRPSN